MARAIAEERWVIMKAMRSGGSNSCCIAMVVGCYSPTFPENQPCSETQNCPQGLTCDIAANECVSEVPATARFVKLSTYDDTACGIDPAGALYCWGRNDRAELGLGDMDRRLVPTRVGVESDWIDVKAGEHLTCGLRAVDQLWCWGDSLDTQSGFILNPRQIAGSYTSVAVGFDMWCAITTGGDLICKRREQPLVPEALPADIVPVQVAATAGTVCVIDTASRLWCYGVNNVNQVGTDDNVDVAVETPFEVPGEYQAVALGDTATCALATDGQLSCWGLCSDGQLGRGDNCGVAAIFPDEPRRYTQMAVGEGQVCAIDTEGNMFCRGSNTAGELGSHGGRPSYQMLEVEGFHQWTSVTAGSRFTCGLRADDEAWCWGDNRFGQLGDGGGGDELEPVAIDPGPFDAVFTGSANGCALREGTLWCWGSNGFGQLGDGTTLERRRPVQIGTAADWQTVALSRVHACGIRTDGTLWCWGNNSDRQLGIGGNLDALVPTQVGNQAGWTEVAVTNQSSCGVRDGLLYCWGLTRSSMPDDPELETPVESLSAAQTDLIFNFLDTTTGQAMLFGPFVPMTIESGSITTWSALERGDNHTCGLIGSELWCFGRNHEGQLGQPFNGEDTPEALRETTNGSWAKVSAGSSATCAISTDDTLSCMGTEVLIGLGDDGSIGSATRVGSAKWKDISVGSHTTCGLQIDGSLHCWGFGTASGRGDGRGGHERPTRVSPP